MRYALVLVALAGCLNSDLPSGSFGMASTDPTVHFSRSTTGLTNYGGTGYYQWNIILATTDGCTGDTIGTFEINSAITGANAFPTGDIPIRAVQVPAAVPSALATFATATGVSGTISITSADASQIQGSADLTLTTGPLTASFIAFPCK